MFNENTAVPDAPAGESEMDRGAPSTIVAQAASEIIPEPSVSSIAPLPWYLDMKYQWTPNANGGNRLVPQDNYVRDVLVEGDLIITAAAKDFVAKNSGDMIAAKLHVKAKIDEMQRLNGIFTSGIEGKHVLRDQLERLVLARKIVGSSEMSMQHRLTNARLHGWDLEKSKQYDGYKSAKEARDRWAAEACFFEYVVRELTDGEIIHNDLAAQIATRVGYLIKDEAYEEGRNVLNPKPRVQEGVAQPEMSKEEMRLATA